MTPYSDIDFGIQTKGRIQKTEAVEILSLFEQVLKKQKWIKNLVSLYKASIPVLKLTVIESALIDDAKEDNKKELKLDIIILEKQETEELPSAIRTTEFINNCIKCYPSFFKLNLIIKYFLNTFKLTDTYSGYFIRRPLFLWLEFTDSEFYNFEEIRPVH